MQTFLIFQTKCTAYCDVEINYLYLEKKNSENKATKYQNFKYQQHIVTHIMAYSTQNMYQMFDIIPNFVRRMFPFSLKTYPSCTNPMAWDRRDEIRSAYILSMVHQRVRKLLPSNLSFLFLIFVYYFFCCLMLVCCEKLLATLCEDNFPFSIHTFMKTRFLLLK